MFRFLPQLSLILLFFSSVSLTHASKLESALIDPSETLEKESKFDDLIGYEYNLWGVKAENKKGSSEYEYTGRIFLDKRKGYKASFDEDEHFFFFKENFSDGEIFKIPGSTEVTKFVNKASANEYYVALKFGPQWKHHQLRDILENFNTNVGDDVGCKNCNFSKSYYDLENDWALTVYYEIKPIFRDSDLSDSEMAQQLLEQLKTKEGFGESEDFVEIASKEKKEIVKEEIAPTNRETLPTSPAVKEEVVAHQNKIVTEKKVITKPLVRETPSPVVNTNSIPIPQIVNQNENSYHVLFRVLNDPDQTFDDLTHLGTLYKETFDARGSTRYLIGNARTIQEAQVLEQKVIQAGYNSTILASYQNGKLREYIDRSPVVNTSVETGNATRGYGKPIQFTAIGKSGKTFSELSHLGEVFSEEVKGRNLYRYKLRPFNDLDIQSVVEEIKKLGFKGAFITE